MKFENLIAGEFVWRDSRFTAAVRIDGELTHAHIANSGRLPGLLSPGSQVWLSYTGHPKRRTQYDLKLVDIDGELVSIDARLPNPLFEEAVKEGRLEAFNFTSIKREVKFGKSRIDFQLTHEEDEFWVETKSVTLVENGIARFPDAPTKRGSRHLQELRKLVDLGHQAGVVFIIQRSDAKEFQPNWAIDPEFSRTLEFVTSQQVLIRGYLCDVSLDSIRIKREINCNLKMTSENFHV